MLLALDCDKTYTEDPVFWDSVISLAKTHGHSVICATMRFDHEGSDIVSALDHKVDRIIYTGRKAKYQFLKDAGCCPSVWIDDTPHWPFQDSF